MYKRYSVYYFDHVLLYFLLDRNKLVTYDEFGIDPLGKFTDGCFFEIEVGLS